MSVGAVGLYEYITWRNGSANKWALLGGCKELQFNFYLMKLCIWTDFAFSSTYDGWKFIFNRCNNYQSGGFTDWIVWSQTIWHFYCLQLLDGRTNRTPFDLLGMKLNWLLVMQLSIQYEMGMFFIENTRTLYNFIFNFIIFLGGFNLWFISGGRLNCFKSYVFLIFCFYG